MELEQTHFRGNKENNEVVSIIHKSYTMWLRMQMQTITSAIPQGSVCHPEVP